MMRDSKDMTDGEIRAIRDECVLRIVRNKPKMRIISIKEKA